MFVELLSSMSMLLATETTIAEPAVSYDTSGLIRFTASQQTYKFYHWINAIINYGDCIEFEDGSNWKISPSDAYKVISWRKDDPVIVTPNHTWFSHYNYSITNQTNGASVEANLFLAPISFGPYTHWIVALDKFSDHLFLEDGSSWKIAFEDRQFFDEYAINDFIIIGHNDTWFTSHNYILINVNMNNHIRAYSF